MPDVDYRNVAEALELGCLKPAVARDQNIIIIDQHWDDEAESPDRGLEFRKLLAIMYPRVSGALFDGFESKMNDLQV